MATNQVSFLSFGSGEADPNNQQSAEGTGGVAKPFSQVLAEARAKQRTAGAGGGIGGATASIGTGSGMGIGGGPAAQGVGGGNVGAAEGAGGNNQQPVGTSTVVIPAANAQPPAFPGASTLMPETREGDYFFPVWNTQPSVSRYADSWYVSVGNQNFKWPYPNAPQTLTAMKDGQNFYTVARNPQDAALGPLGAPSGAFSLPAVATPTSAGSPASLLSEDPAAQYRFPVWNTVPRFQQVDGKWYVFASDGTYSWGYPNAPKLVTTPDGKYTLARDPLDQGLPTAGQLPGTTTGTPTGSVGLAAPAGFTSVTSGGNNVYPTSGPLQWRIQTGTNPQYITYGQLDGQGVYRFAVDSGAFASNGYRTEFVGPAIGGSTRTYSFNTYFPTQPHPGGGPFFQLHAPGFENWGLHIGHFDSSGKNYIQLGMGSSLNVWQTPWVQNQWVNWKISINPSNSTMVLYMNGQQVYSGATPMGIDSSWYPKYGLYRMSSTYYPANSSFTSVVYATPMQVS